MSSIESENKESVLLSREKKLKVESLEETEETRETEVEDGKEGKETKEIRKEESSLDAEEDWEARGTIKLTSKDKKEFTVETKFAVIATLVKTTLQQDKTATEVRIPGVLSSSLALVIEYMNHHKGTEPPIIPKPLRSKEMKQVCSDPWDAQYIDKIGDVRQDLYDLILAANYLDIKSLLHLGCAKVASLIKGQPLEKIKEILTQGMSKADTDGKESKEKKVKS